MKKNIIWLSVALLVTGTAIVIFLLNSEPGEKRNFTIGIINPNPGSKRLNNFFGEGLQERSRKEDWHLTFHRCENRETLDADLHNLVARRPDLIFTVTTPGTKKAIDAFSQTNTPGIFILFDPVAAGLIKTLASPGGNFTGIQLRGGILKALEWLLTIAPETKNIYVPIRYDTEAAKMSLADLKTAAAAAGVKITVVELQSKKELTEDLQALPDDIDAIFLLNSILISTHTGVITQAAIQKRLPTAATIGKCEEGVLLSYSTRHAESGRQASRLAYLVLQGEHPGNIPAEIADFFLCVNLQTAERIGMKFTDSVLSQSDEVVR